MTPIHPPVLIARVKEGDRLTAHALTRLAVLSDSKRDDVAAAWIACGATMEPQTTGRATIRWNGQTGHYELFVAPPAPGASVLDCRFCGDRVDGDVLDHFGSACATKEA